MDSSLRPDNDQTVDAIGAANRTAAEVDNSFATTNLTQNNKVHHKTLEAQYQIQKWISSNPKIAPYKSEEILSQLWVEQQKLMSEGGAATTSSTGPDSNNVLITTDTVNLVLQAWTHSNSGEMGACRAERLLFWMEGLADAGADPWILPNYRSYALVIEAWSRAAVYEASRLGLNEGEDEAKKVGFECARRCEDLLMHMQKMHELRCCNSLQDEDDAPSGRQSTFYSNDIQPDTHVFHHVLTAWGNIRGSKATAMRATRILDLMQELHHYQSMDADTWQGVGVSKVQPNLVTYKILLRAWANTGTAEGADRVEMILRHLLSISKAGNVGVEIYPDEECFHIVMKAHADSVHKRRKGGSTSSENNAADRARQVVALLDWMELLASRRAFKMKPNRETYRIAMSAWAWSRDIDAPKEAEAILFRMISASQLNSVEDAVDLILGGGSGKTNSKRNATNSGACNVHPETRDFNTVINCCAFARGVGESPTELDDDEALLHLQQAKKEIFSIAESVFDSLLQSDCAKPDVDTFLGMIRACRSLLPNNEDRDAKVIELFRLAYRTSPPSSEHALSHHKPVTTYSERLQAPKGGGCVNANVLRQLRLALPSTEEYINVREEFEEHRRQNRK
jgi:hypothetical protein